MNRKRQSNLSSTKAVFTLAPKHVSKIISAILENFKFYRLSTGYYSPTLIFLVECRCCCYCCSKLERFKVLMNHVYTASGNTAKEFCSILTLLTVAFPFLYFGWLTLTFSVPSGFVFPSLRKL